MYDGKVISWNVILTMENGEEVPFMIENLDITDAIDSFIEEQYSVAWDDDDY